MLKIDYVIVVNIKISQKTRRTLFPLFSTHERTSGDAKYRFEFISTLISFRKNMLIAIDWVGLHLRRVLFSSLQNNPGLCG